MRYANLSVEDTDAATGSTRLFKDLHATLRGEDKLLGPDPSLSGVFRRFTHSAREEGFSAERVVIALKRAYRAWIPIKCPGQDDELPRLVTLSIETYYADEPDNHNDAGRRGISAAPLRVA
jgi:hypothetical protein